MTSVQQPPATAGVDLKRPSSSKWLRNVALAAIVLLVFLQLPSLCTGCDGHVHHHHHHHHDHDHHDHHDEMPASFKYSREANEQPLPPVRRGHGHDDHHLGHDHHNEHDHQHHQHHSSGSKSAPKPELGKNPFFFVSKDSDV